MKNQPKRQRVADGKNQGLDLDKVRQHKKTNIPTKHPSNRGEPSLQRSPFDHTKSSVPPEHEQIQLLAAVLYANMAGTATVEETGPGELRIQIKGQSFKLAVGAEGRVLLSGFPQNPNLEQHVGRISDDRVAGSILSTVQKTITLIGNAMEKDEPPEPAFFPSTEVVQEIQGDSAGDLPPPKTSVSPGDKTEDFSQAPDDLDASMGADTPPPPPSEPVQDIAPPAGMGPGAPPPPAAPGLEPIPAAGAAPGFDLGPPTASRKAAVKELDSIAEYLEKKGFLDLALRVDFITNTLDER